MGLLDFKKTAGDMLDFSAMPGFDQAAAWMSNVLNGDAGSYSSLLDWTYRMAANANIPGLDSAQELSKEYLAKTGTMEEKVDKLISSYQVKTGLIGAATGTGGMMTLPVNLVSITLLQMRMAAAIALMGGWSLEDEKVKKAVILSEMGSGPVDSLSGEEMEKAVKKGALNLTGKIVGKSVPLVGMMISGAIDASTTKTIGKAAKEWFIMNLPTAMTVLTQKAEFVD